MVALPLGSQLTMDANLDMASRTPVAATPSRNTLNTIDQLRPNSYEVPNRGGGGVRPAPAGAAPARLVTSAEIRGEAHLRPEIRVAPAGVGRPSQLNLPVSKASVHPTTPTRSTRQGFAAPPANGNLTPKVTQRPVGTRGSGGNVTPVSASPGQSGRVVAPNLATDSRPQPKYITEQELEERLKEHKRQVEDMLRQFCRTFEVGLQRQAKQEAEGDAEKQQQEDVTLASATQQLNSRCEQVEAVLNRLEMQLQDTSISTIRHEDRLNTTEDIVCSHTQCIEELRRQMDEGFSSQDTAQKLLKRDLPVVHERYCNVEAPAADEAAGSPLQDGDRTPRGVLARATAVTSVSSSPYPAGSHGSAATRVGQRAVPSGIRLRVPTGDASDPRSGINFPSFDEQGADYFFGPQNRSDQQQPAAM